MTPASKWLAGLLAFATCGIGAARALEPLVTNYGIGTFLHPMEDVPVVPLPNNFHQLRCVEKDQVHIYGVNGLNPMCLGNFNGLCKFIREQGFKNTHFDQLYTCDDIPDRILAVRKQDSNARIVLIGFSLGANSVRSIANELNTKGVRVDLMIYLVGDFIHNTAESQPTNVGRIVNVRAKGLVLSGGDLFFNGADLDAAHNEKLTCRHILVPSRRETQELCIREVLATMCRHK